MDLTGFLLGMVGFALGGILKGATGAGAPIIAVPVLAMVYNVPMAVAIFTLPNLVSNAWQAWQYREHQVSPRFVWTFAGAGMAGVAVGSLLLAWASSNALLLGIAGTVFAYIGFRLARPGWRLPIPLANILCGPLGFIAGILQGATGVSAPVSVTFLSAMKLERRQFMATVSVFFAAMTVVQIPLLVSLGILTWDRAAMSLVAMIPIMAMMPVGAWLANRLSKETFDKIILGLLAVVATRLIFRALG